MKKEDIQGIWQMLSSKVTYNKYIRQEKDKEIQPANHMESVWVGGSEDVCACKGAGTPHRVLSPVYRKPSDVMGTTSPHPTLDSLH